MAPICMDPSCIFSAGDTLSYILIGPFGPVTFITLPSSGLGDRILSLIGALSLIVVCTFEPFFSRILAIDRYLLSSVCLSLEL